VIRREGDDLKYLNISTLSVTEYENAVHEDFYTTRLRRSANTGSETNTLYRGIVFEEIHLIGWFKSLFVYVFHSKFK